LHIQQQAWRVKMGKKKREENMAAEAEASQAVDTH
jgi:hypothetical protein